MSPKKPNNTGKETRWTRKKRIAEDGEAQRPHILKRYIEETRVSKNEPKREGLKHRGG